MRKSPLGARRNGWRKNDHGKRRINSRRGKPDGYFFFSSFLLYISWGLLKSVFSGLLDRIPGGDPLLDEEDDELDDRAEVRSFDYAELGPRAPISDREPDIPTAREDQA